MNGVCTARPGLLFWGVVRQDPSSVVASQGSGISTSRAPLHGKRWPGRAASAAAAGAVGWGGALQRELGQCTAAAAGAVHGGDAQFGNVVTEPGWGWALDVAEALGLHAGNARLSSRRALAELCLQRRCYRFARLQWVVDRALRWAAPLGRR